MFQLGPIGNRIGLQFRDWWIVIRSHPLRVRIVCSFAASALLLWLLRHYLWIHVPIWVHSASHPIFATSQAHPVLLETVHVLINTVPDMAFFFLAIAGLAYLLPSRILKRIDDLLWVRIVLIIFFCTWGFAAIIINAVNREEEDQTKNDLRSTISDQNKKLDGVNDSNNKILNYFVSNKTMTETERRENIEKSLRSEYILSHNQIDPGIIAGVKMPPDDWANARLAQLGEKWKQSTPPSVLYSPPSPLPQPDISAGIVYPNEISLLIANNSEAAIRDISVLVLLWDLDNLGEPISNLPISVTMKDEVIQKHTWLVPYSLAGNPSVKNQIKKGDRIFGFITVGCGECVDISSTTVD
jgi:hypothetical protein